MSEYEVCADCEVILHPSSPWYWWPTTADLASAVVYPLCQLCSDCRYVEQGAPA